ncbi:hypothetical protein [Euzebyella saccharophila]|uniref:Uncharacterized protein n=1 Tax=Euzebyella saccharophila TaxID=679664 RepID=A0ABV8JQX1_9FLAO|nr:hypothetical protein [Euzebyella saccharophila]
MDDVEKIFFDLEEYRKSESANCFYALNKPRTVFKLYLLNYIDLKKELKSYYVDDDFLFSDNSLRRAKQKNLLKCFQNVLSSARIYVSMFVENDYEDDFHCFMKELRNYSIHKSVFPLSSRIRVTQTEVKRYESFQIDKIKNDLLNEIDNSKSKKAGLKKALSFIQSHEPEIILNELFENYYYKLKKHYYEIMIQKIKENRNELLKLQNLDISITRRMLENNVKNSYLLTPSKRRYLSFILNKVL